MPTDSHYCQCRGVKPEQYRRARKPSVPTLDETDNQLLCGSTAYVIAIEFQDAASKSVLHPFRQTRLLQSPKQHVEPVLAKKWLALKGACRHAPMTDRMMIGLVIHNFGF